MEVDERESTHATEGVKRERQTARACRRTDDSHDAETTNESLEMQAQWNDMQGL